MKKFIIAIISGILLLSLVGCGEQARQRAVKDREASENGLNRILEVYSHDGKLLKKYEGQFDIDSNTSQDGGTTGTKIKFDIKGKRVIIYNAIVITEEK